MASRDVTPSEDTSFRLREYLGVLRVHKWSIIAITILGTLVAVLYTRAQPSVYTSTSQVLVTDPLQAIGGTSQTSAAAKTSQSLGGTQSALVLSNNVSTCAYLISQNPSGTADKICSSDNMKKAVVPPKFTKVMQPALIPQTTIMTLPFTSHIPAAAQVGAQSYARAYVWYEVQQATDFVNTLRAPLLKKQTDLNTSIAAQNALVAKDLSALTADATTRGAAPGQSAKYSTDLSRLSQLQNQLAAVQGQLIQIDVSKITPPKITKDALLPTIPSNKITKILAIAAGFIIGLALGIGQALLRDRLNDHIRGRVDLENRLGAPVLATIPRIRNWRRKKETHLITVEQPRAPAAEAYRTLRTNVLFAASQQGLKVLTIVSPTAGEGKTTTACNLAVVLAEAGKKVILVSGDLRKPRVGRFFNVNEEGQGLSEVLSGQTKAYEAIQPSSVETLRILTGGAPASHPSEMLQSDEMKDLLTELKSVSDFVIVDTAPVLLVSDALSLSAISDGVLFVAEASSTTRSAVMRAQEELAQVDTPVIGAILNNFDPSKVVEYPYASTYYSGRYYRYGYGHANSGNAREREPVSTAVDGEASRPNVGVSASGRDPFSQQPDPGPVRR